LHLPEVKQRAADADGAIAAALRLKVRSMIVAPTPSVYTTAHACPLD
jgi:hypothetical protein